MMSSETNKNDVETQQPPNPPETATAAAGEDHGETRNNAVRVGGYEIYNDALLPYVGIFFSGLILLIALTTGDGISDHKYYEYGIAVAVVAMCVSLLGYTLSSMERNETQLFSILNVFLFVWNFIGTCTITFGGPFKTTSNGYFAAWGIVFFAIMALGVTATQIREEFHSTLGSLMGILASSVVLIVAIIWQGFDWHKNELIYAIVVAALSIPMALGLAHRNATTTLDVVALAVCAILWIVAACLLTFSGPFIVTGNGYFSSWFGAVTSVFAVMAARRAATQPQS